MNIEEIVEQMNAIVSAAEAETRSLTDEEVTQYEALEADLQKARASNEVLKRNRIYNAPNVILTPGNKAKGDEVLERAFEDYLRTGQKNMDLAELRAQSEGADSAGGYTVPDGFRAKIVQKMESFGGVASVAETINTSTGAPLPWAVDTAAADPDDAEITAENAKFSTGADITFDTATLGAYKYTSVGDSGEPLRVSVELLQDSAFNIGDYVSRKLGERIRRKQAEDYAIGDGSGEPLGLFTTTGDVTGSLTYANAIEMVYSVDAAYRQNGKWLFSDAGVKALALQTDLSGRPLWNSSTEGLEGRVGGNFLGYPVVVDNASPTMASGVAYAAFGDFREGYVIRNVKDITVVVNPYSRANYGQVEYVAWARSDGTIQNRDAYATIKGS